jgi:16S rRNA (cytosine967-C5)-methyltransferase
MGVGQLQAMHPKALLDTAAELLRAVLTFEHPADAVVSRFFRDHRNLGPRERATLAETTYNVLRKKLLFEAYAQGAPKGSGDKARRLAILGFDVPRDFLKSALTDAEKAWVDACDATRLKDASSGLMDMHRHNLPDWLVPPLKAQLGDEFWAFVDATNSAAPLDLRVNSFKQKRDAAREILAQAAIKSVATPFSPWGLRLEGKPQINKLALFEEGAIEVQDEGSQLLALLLDAKRGEMVADFCAGAGGKTLAIGAAMRSTGRLYAFDTSAHRLEALKPRLARSGLSNVHPAAITHERDERIKRLAGKMDRVLVDAPCSGLGTLRRNPDLKWRQKPQDLEELAQAVVAWCTPPVACCRKRTKPLHKPLAPRTPISRHCLRKRCLSNSKYPRLQPCVTAVRKTRRPVCTCACGPSATPPTASSQPCGKSISLARVVTFQETSAERSKNLQYKG